MSNIHKVTKISRLSRESLMIHSRMLPLLLVWSRMDYICIEYMKEHHDWETHIHCIHQLFATIIAKCEVNKHKTFYKTCKSYLHTDFLYKHKVEFPKNHHLQKYIGNKMTVESNDELSLSDEDVVEDDKIVL